MKRSLLLIITIQLLMSCSRVQPNPTAYLKQQLVSNNCSNSCWLGIEPGIPTDLDSIEKALSQSYGIENVYTPPKPNQSILWSVTDSTFPQHGAVALNQNNQVANIQVFFDEKQITIGDFVSAIGEPDYVLLIGVNSSQGFQCNAIWGMLYLHTGLEVLTDQTIDSIENSQFIGYIGIEQPSDIEEKHWWSDPSIYKVTEWHGYGNYCSTSE